MNPLTEQLMYQCLAPCLVNVSAFHLSRLGPPGESVSPKMERKKEMFYLRLYGISHMVKDHSDSEKGNLLRHIGYSFQLAARVLLYAPSHIQDSTYHSLCYTSRGELAGTRNSSMGPPHEGSIQ